MFFGFLLQPNKLSNDLVQQFLLPDQTPPILEAEMSLRAEQADGCGGRAPTPDTHKEEGGREERTQQHKASEERRAMTRTEPEEERKEVAEQVEQTEERLQPEGRQSEAILPESDRRQVGSLAWVRGGSDGFRTLVPPLEGFTFSVSFLR